MTSSVGHWCSPTRTNLASVKGFSRERRNIFQQFIPNLSSASPSGPRAPASNRSETAESSTAKSQESSSSNCPSKWKRDDGRRVVKLMMRSGKKITAMKDVVGRVSILWFRLRNYWPQTQTHTRRGTKATKLILRSIARCLWTAVTSPSSSPAAANLPACSSPSLPCNNRDKVLGKHRTRSHGEKKSQKQISSH